MLLLKKIKRIRANINKKKKNFFFSFAQFERHFCRNLEKYNLSIINLLMAEYKYI